MELLKYYEFVVKGNAKGGVLHAPESWPRPIAIDGEEVRNWKSLVVELKDGPYRNFHMCVGWANMVSVNLKDLLQSLIGDKEYLEFLPVQAVSEEYGNKVYYIMHFKKIFDVIDKERTIYVPNTDSIIKPWLDYQKVKDLSIFNSRPIINDIIVSSRVRKEIVNHKLNDGLDFMPVYCIKY